MSLRQGDDPWSDKTMNSSGEVILDAKWLRTKTLPLTQDWTQHDPISKCPPPQKQYNSEGENGKKILNGLISFGN